MTDLDAVQDIHALLDSVDLIAIEIGCALFEFGEVLDGAQAALGGVDLLIEHSSETGRIQSEAPFLRSVIRIQVKLAGCVSIHMAIETGNSQTRLTALAIISGIEFLLREWSQQ